MALGWSDFCDLPGVRIFIPPRKQSLSEVTFKKSKQRRILFGDIVVIQYFLNWTSAPNKRRVLTGDKHIKRLLRGNKLIGM